MRNVFCLTKEIQVAFKALNIKIKKKKKNELKFEMFSFYNLYVTIMKE